MTTSSKKVSEKRNYKSARRTVVIALVIVVFLVSIGYSYLGLMAFAICGLLLISFIPWRLTTYGRPADPGPIVVPYLLGVILFKIHVGEEYFTHIWTAFSSIGQPMTEGTFFLVAATVGPIFWLIGLILLYRRTEIGNWMAWVFVVAIGLIEASHFLFPFMAEGHFGYFSGMYTCILPIIAGWYLAFLLWRDGKRNGQLETEK